MQCNARMPETRPRRVAPMGPLGTLVASSTLSLAAHPPHEVSTLQTVPMVHVQRSKRTWHEDLDVMPRNSRGYHNFMV